MSVFGGGGPMKTASTEEYNFSSLSSFMSWNVTSYFRGSSPRKIVRLPLSGYRHLPLVISPVVRMMWAGLSWFG